MARNPILQLQRLALRFVWVVAGVFRHVLAMCVNTFWRLRFTLVIRRSRSVILVRHRYHRPSAILSVAVAIPPTRAAGNMRRLSSQSYCTAGLEPPLTNILAPYTIGEAISSSTSARACARLAEHASVDSSRAEKTHQIKQSLANVHKRLVALQDSLSWTFPSSFSDTSLTWALHAPRLATDKR